jgi:hypothetical protein
MAQERYTLAHAAFLRQRGVGVGENAHLKGNLEN